MNVALEELRGLDAHRNARNELATRLVEIEAEAGGATLNEAQKAEFAEIATPDTGLMARLDEWLGPAVGGVTRRTQLDALDTAAAVARLLDPAQRARLAALAPTHVPLPGGRRAAVDYAAPGGPAVRVKLQEVFGAQRIEGVVGGRVPVVIHLLSPAMRPVQVPGEGEGGGSLTRSPTPL